MGVDRMFEEEDRRREEAYQSRIAPLKARIEELERLLRMVEWVDQPNGEYPPWCPWCEYIQPDHDPDCPRQKVLSGS